MFGGRHGGLPDRQIDFCTVPVGSYLAEDTDEQLGIAEQATAAAYLILRKAH
ncbi:hypothetical protein [Tsukamurella soli]|uniref:Uncharacterized protein n=1 Tax=Tsukamurella soli TaxID=644556 RepID=A0ABP8JAL4_9ACTN